MNNQILEVAHSRTTKHSRNVLFGFFALSHLGFDAACIDRRLYYSDSLMRNGGSIQDCASELGSSVGRLTNREPIVSRREQAVHQQSTDLSMGRSLDSIDLQMPHEFCARDS